MTSTFNSISENNLKIVGDFVFDLLKKSYKNLILEAEVGVGKTTFINYLLLHYFNIKSSGSPTFTIINQYKNNDITINHIDLYRVKEFDSYILEEIDNADYNFIEWPYKLSSELDSFIILKINDSLDGYRSYEVIY